MDQITRDRYLQSYQKKAELEPVEWTVLVDAIGAFPGELRAAADLLVPGKLGARYRAGGWDAAQLIRHIGDSSMVLYTRTKFVMAEDGAALQPFPENLWAQLGDSDGMHALGALTLVEAVHANWATLLRHASPAQWAHTFRHPEKGTGRLDQLVDHAVWHMRHHLAQLYLIQHSPVY